MSELANDTTDRLASFEQRVAAIGHRTNDRDRVWVRVGVGLMVAGIVLAIVGYQTSTAQADQRDVLSAGILALVGVGLSIVGGAIYLKSALTQFLRFWMLRLLLEQQRESDR